MNANKMLEVVRQYRALLLHIPPEAGPFDKQPSPREAYAHLHGMLDKIEEFVRRAADLKLQDLAAWDKANRWLGFMQGVFWLNGTYTLDQLRDHNRTAKSLQRSKSPQ